MENHPQKYSMSDESSKKWYHKIIKETYAFAMGLVVILPFMLAFVYVATMLQNTELLEKMVALLGGLVAVIIGYYFGQRPVQQLTEQVKKSGEVAQQLTQQVKKSGEETQQNKDLFSESKVDLLDLLEDFDEIKKGKEELKTRMEKRKYE